jgi:hypothetical protein
MNNRLISRLARTAGLFALAAVATATLQSAAAPNANGPNLRPMPMNTTGTSGGMPPTSQIIWATVDATGTKINSFPKTTTATHLSTGDYEVDVYEAVETCSYQATVGVTGSGSAAGFATVAPRSGNTKGVFVSTFNTSGVATDEPFHLAIIC